MSNTANIETGDVNNYIVVAAAPVPPVSIDVGASVSANSVPGSPKEGVTPASTVDTSKETDSTGAPAPVPPASIAVPTSIGNEHAVRTATDTVTHITSKIG